MTNPNPQADLDVEVETSNVAAGQDGVTVDPAADPAGDNADVDRDHEADPNRDPEPELSVHDLPGGLRAAIEAILMVADEPLPEVRIAAALAVPADEVRVQLEDLATEYDAHHRGFELARAAGGWRFYSRARWAPVVGRLILEGQTARLSKAALETLAVIAYRQPVSRTRVAAVRGVSVDAVFRTLRTRGLIDEVDTDEVTGAVRYGTTPLFLELMGLQDLTELPSLAPLLPDLDVLDEHPGL